MRWLDLLVVVWVALWVVMVVVASDVRQLADLSASITSTGRALEGIVGALTPLRGLPFVGGQSAPLQAHAQTSAHSVSAGSQNVTTAIRELAVLLGLAIAIAPTAPLVALYVPQRVAWERDRRYPRLLIASGNRTVAVDEALAWRAFSRMRLSRLVTPTSTVLADASPQRVRAVADMELRRLGVKAAPGEAPTATGRRSWCR